MIHHKCSINTTIFNYCRLYLIAPVLIDINRYNKIVFEEVIKSILILFLL